MMRTIAVNRVTASAVIAGATWVFGHLYVPFPLASDLVVLVANGAPHVVAALCLAHAVMWFTTPFIISSILLSFGYVFLVKPRRGSGQIIVPRYPALNRRDDLFLVVGELHNARRPLHVERPQWLTITRRALFTGIAIFGAIGTGKTSCCMYPFAEQILSYRRADRQRRIGGLVLEVKGDFCYRLQEILRRHGREDDYVEISLDCPYRYNPLHNDLEAYALAYGIASLLTNLFGRGKEPFWQQAYTNLVKFIILLHKSVYRYVTLFDVYECAISLYFKIHRSDYYDQLQRVRTHGDWEGWLRFFLTGVTETAQQATTTANNLWTLFDADRRRIQEQGKLAVTALRVHDLLQQKPIVSIPAASGSLALTYPAVNKSLRRLEDMGIVRELTGRQRNRLYVYDAYLNTLTQGMEIVG